MDRPIESDHDLFDRKKGGPSRMCALLLWLLTADDLQFEAPSSLSGASPAAHVVIAPHVNARAVQAHTLADENVPYCPHYRYAAELELTKAQKNRLEQVLAMLAALDELRSDRQGRRHLQVAGRCLGRHHHAAQPVDVDGVGLQIERTRCAGVVARPITSG
jgi:hypothetical protein